MMGTDGLLLILEDVECGLVLGTAPTACAAQMLALGMPNTQVDALPVGLPHRSGEWDDYDFDAPDRFYVVSRGWKVAPAPADLYTPANRRRRQLTRLRLTYLHAWEIYCKGALARVHGYMSEFAHALILQEASTDRAGGFVDEYAAMQGLEREAARAELAMKARSRGMLEARNWAQYETIAREMGCASNRQELDACMRRGLERLYDGARL